MKDLEPRYEYHNGICWVPLPRDLERQAKLRGSRLRPIRAEAGTIPPESSSEGGMS